MEKAAAALGSSEDLRSIKGLLKRAAKGGVELDEFVDTALSPRYFGAAGAGVVRDQDQSQGEGGWGEEPALLELISSLPDEHTELRSELRARVEERMRRAAA